MLFALGFLSATVTFAAILHTCRTEVFDCRTGRTLCWLPRPVARFVVVPLSRLIGRTFDYSVEVL